MQEIRGYDHQPLLSIEYVNHQWVILQLLLKTLLIILGLSLWFPPFPTIHLYPGHVFEWKPMERLLFLVWVLACCREKWGTEVCKHLSAHPGAFFWLMLAETWRVIEIRNILNKFRGLPRQNNSQHQGLFFYLSPDNDLLGLDPIYCLFLPGCLCPVSHKSYLPDVCVFVRVSSVPWNGLPCQCTLPVMSHLVPLLWTYTVLHLLWTQETYQCVQRALLRHFGSLDISPLCILSKLSFTDALFRPVVCLPPLHG